MAVFINIVNMKTNGVSQNGNIDIGNALQNSHTSNNKLVGVNFSVGDLSPSFSNMNSVYFDPDVSDQDQIANPSAPVANQI
jgi:hypothetical protein